MNHTPCPSPPVLLPPAQSKAYPTNIASPAFDDALPYSRGPCYSSTPQRLSAIYILLDRITLCPVTTSPTVSPTEGPTSSDPTASPTRPAFDECWVPGRDFYGDDLGECPGFYARSGTSPIEEHGCADYSASLLVVVVCLQHRAQTDTSNAMLATATGTASSRPRSSAQPPLLRLGSATPQSILAGPLMLPTHRILTDAT